MLLIICFYQSERDLKAQTQRIFMNVLIMCGGKKTFLLLGTIAVTEYNSMTLCDVFRGNMTEEEVANYHRD